jgi:hypothetical protein
MGQCINPYELPDEILFSYEHTSDGIKLIPNKHNCQHNYILESFIESTINFLGLNSPTLLKHREKAFYSTINIINDFLLNNEKSIFIIKIKEFYNSKDLEFITTIKLIIKNFLMEIGIVDLT